MSRGARIIIAHVAFLRKRRGTRLSAAVAKIAIASQNQSVVRNISPARFYVTATSKKFYDDRHDLNDNNQ